MPLVDWKLFDSGAFGSGSLQLAYSAARYGTRQSAGDVQGALGLITPFNDYAERQNTFAQLTYTHALPGNKVALTVGQYPHNFDGNQYGQPAAELQQTCCRRTAVPPMLGLGAYVQSRNKHPPVRSGPTKRQQHQRSDASSKNFGDDGYSVRLRAMDAQHQGLGAAQYSVTYYTVPSVPAQSPKSHGWSLNAVQNLSETWRFCPRQQSLRLRDDDPRSRAGRGDERSTRREATDQIGLAFGYSDAAPQPVNPAGTRDEKLVETYWNLSFAMACCSARRAIHPRPGSDPSRDSAGGVLATTLMF
jgi:hypothetical protein